MATAVTTMTGTEFDALPYDEGRALELLDGEQIPASSPTLEHQEIVFRILIALKQHLSNAGAIVSHDVGFALSHNTRLRPDVWAILAPRMAGINPSIVPIAGSPDLALEVISPSEYAADSMRKVAAYLDHGAREDWQVYPKTREVLIYAPHGKVSKCRADENLTGSLLGDLGIPVSRLFQ
jgi:Uma2 family endonuclease